MNTLPVSLLSVSECSVSPKYERWLPVRQKGREVSEDTQSLHVDCTSAAERADCDTARCLPESAGLFAQEHTEAFFKSALEGVNVQEHTCKAVFHCLCMLMCQQAAAAKRRVLRHICSSPPTHLGTLLPSEV